MSSIRSELLVACCLMLPACTHAQVSGLKEDAPFRPSLSHNYWLEVVHNQGPSSLEAFYSSFSCSNGGGLRGVLFDSRFNYSGNRTIPPDGSVQVSAADPSDCTGGVKAAVYSDGHLEGGYEGLKQIFDRRKGAYEGLTVVIQLLDQVAEGQRTSPELIDALQSSLDKLISDHTQKADGSRFIYAILKEDWKQGGGLVVPSDDTPSKGPGVDEVMKTQRVSLEQARAIVLSRKLKEWRAALEGHAEMLG